MQSHSASRNTSETFSVRVDAGIKERLTKLAESTGRSRSFLTTQAIAEYLDANEWQVAGVREAMTSIDQGGGVAHDDVRRWVSSWGAADETAKP